MSYLLVGYGQWCTCIMNSGRVDSEYEYVKLKFLEGNKAVLSVKAKLMVSSEDRYYETQTVKPLEFEYAY